MVELELYRLPQRCQRTAVVCVTYWMNRLQNIDERETAIRYA